MSALSPAREIAPFNVVRDFEAALCEYTGAPYAVTVTSCTAALMLAWRGTAREGRARYRWRRLAGCGVRVEIPKRTYVGVPHAIIEAGGRPTFRDEDWRGFYQLKPLPVWDCARLFTANMCDQVSGAMSCVSFHWTKTLGIQQGGAILHDDPEADAWLRRARFDGRTGRRAARDGHVPTSSRVALLHEPETAAAGLVRLRTLPKHNDPASERRVPGPFAARGLPMNRTQRRAQMRAEKRSRPMAQQAQQQFNIRHGHTDEHVLVQFPQAVPNLLLSIAQAEAFISAMKDSIEKLKTHQATRLASRG
jgi:dTDP-4-amino-4,6-dideoxygalactose transaminase